MADISIEKKEKEDGWQFAVSVTENNSSTTHKVLLSKKYYLKLSKEKCTPEALVKKSFEFLLEREPKESIMSKFDLAVISRFFPEYEEEISRVL